MKPMKLSSTIVACFVGGAVCTLVALLCAPAYWWLGLLAGFSAGYISGDFGEVLRAVPVALSRAWKQTDQGIRKAAAAAREFFRKPHEVLYPGLVVGVPLAAYVFSLLYADIQRGILTGEVDDMSRASVMYLISSVIASGVVPCCTILLQMLLAFIGCRKERRFWYPFLVVVEGFFPRLVDKGLSPAALTYRNYLRWMAKGVLFSMLFIIRFFAWALWKEAVCFLCRFLYNLFILLHSEKRLMWGVDSAIGGGTAYLWLAASAETSLELALLVVFGGIIGAAFGTLNRELFVVRLRLAPVRLWE
ncbi:hypothetical protein HY491_02335 [Candidatus Woesearchaeota archaeon]|nr:hypothetical protein [Candidatus Woesearchaeota archaeon]